MKKYKHAKGKKPTERVSFYIALSICVMAVGMALWSAYTSFGDVTEEEDESYFASLSSPTAAVAQDMTGVTEPPTENETAPATADETPLKDEPAEDQKSFIVSETNPEAEDVAHVGGLDPLQAVLRVKESLNYPVKSQSVIRPYSESGVYNKKMRDYRAHTGCDFGAEKGESVYAMCRGTVKNISVSELYGVIAEVDCGDFSVYYCGMSSDLKIDKGSEVDSGDTIGTVGTIPCESDAEPHVHIEVRVGDRLIDPLSVIDSER